MQQSPNKLKVLMSGMLKQGIGWGSEGDSKEKKKTNKVVIVFLLFVILPVLLALGFISYFLTYIGADAQAQTNVIILGMCIAGIIMLFFGLLMVPGIFYYSDDVTAYLPMPVKEIDVINAKLVTTWIWENMTSIVVFIPILIGSFIALQGNLILQIIMSILVSASLSLVPMLYGIIVIVLLVRFTGFGINKKKLSFLTSFVSIILTVWLSVAMLDFMLGQSSYDLFERMISDNNSFVAFINMVFPHFRYGADAIVNGNLVSLGIYFIFQVFVVGIYYVVVKTCYRKGLLKVISGGERRFSKKKKLPERYGGIAYRSLVKRELNNLIHHPTFFSSCISTSAIFPLFFLFLGTTHVMNTFKSWYYYYGMHNSLWEILFLILLFVIPAGMNYVASTSISRDGEDYTYYKYAPIQLEEVVYSKITASLIVATITYFISVFIIRVGLGIPIGLFSFIYGSVFGEYCTLFFCILGVFIDSYNPTLLWKEANKAVKENFNGVIVLVLTLNFGIGLYFIVNQWGTNGLNILMIILIALGLFLVSTTVKVLQKSLEKN